MSSRSTTPAEAFFDTLAGLAARIPWWAIAVPVPALIAALALFHTSTRPLIFSEVGLLLCACLALAKLKRGSSLKHAHDIETICAMTWREFRPLISEAFHRQGYVVFPEASSGEEGGIDLKMHRDSELTVVQCRQWKTTQIGVKPLRKLYGLMMADNARAAIFITAGSFTAEAKEFAHNLPIEMIDGDDLIKLVHTVRRDITFRPAPIRAERVTSPASHVAAVSIKPPAAPQPTPVAAAPVAARAHSSSNGASTQSPPVSAPPHCPLCASSMVKHVALRGGSTKVHVWVCNRYPECYGTRDV